MNDAASRALFDTETGNIVRLIQLRGWKVYAHAHPIIDVGFPLRAGRELRVRLTADQWNEQPPSVALLRSDGSFATKEDLPAYGGTIFNHGPHHTTGQPFVCMAGIREYHTHPSHIPDHWSNYRTRSDFNLAGLLTQLWSASLKLPS